MGELSLDTIIYFVKYILALFLLFIVAPRLIFTYNKENVTESLLSNYIKLIFWFVAAGYIAVWIRLFELITIVVVMVMAAIYKYYKNSIIEENPVSELSDDVRILVINHVERVESIESKLLLWWERRIARFKHILSMYFGDIWVLINALLLGVVFGCLAYISFFDALVHVSPTGHEGYLSLLRAKLIENRIMFYDGIYPQGFYILLATIRKFAQVDALYIVNFTGPIFWLITCFGTYFFVSRTSQALPCGIIAVLGMGWMGKYFITGGLRSNPVEASIMLVFPVLYFLYRYSDRGDRADLYISGFGAAAIGLIHPIGFVLLALGAITLVVTFLITNLKNCFFKISRIFGIVTTATVIMVLPGLVGYLSGIPLNKTAFDAIIGQGRGGMAFDSGYLDYVALAGLMLTLIHAIINIRNKDKLAKKLWVCLFGAAAFAAHVLLPGVQYTYIAARSSLAWVFMIPILIAFGAAAVFATFAKIFKFRNPGYLTCTLLILAILIFFPQRPYIAQRGKDDESIARHYLKISATHRPTQWIMVAWEEAASLAYGSGYYIAPDEFVKRYSPYQKNLVDKSGPLSKRISTSHIFIFIEKDEKQMSKERIETRQDMIEWLTKYKKQGGNISLYSSDDSFDVINIYLEPDRQEAVYNMWDE